MAQGNRWSSATRYASIYQICLFIQGPNNKPISLQDLKSLDGYRIMKVATSRFCRPEILRKLTEALDNAQVS